MSFFSKGDRDIINKKCVGCICSRCRNLENGVCKFKYNQCIGKEEKTCKMESCSEYKK